MRPKVLCSVKGHPFPGPKEHEIGVSEVAHPGFRSGSGPRVAGMTRHRVVPPKA
jgi:hypothetical protein